MQYLCFCVRLTSFIIMSSNFMLLQDIWQNQYNIVKFKNKIKFKKSGKNYFFLRLTNILICFCQCIYLSMSIYLCIYLCLSIYVSIYLSICPLMDTEVASIPWLLWIMLQWTCGCEYLFEIMTLFLLDHMVVLALISWETSILFSTIYIPTSRLGGSPFFFILICTCYLMSFW